MMSFQLQFSSFAEFLEMGIYTFHVWSVYGLFALFIAYNLSMPIYHRRLFVRDQQRREQRQARRDGSRRRAGNQNGPVGQNPGDSQ